MINETSEEPITSAPTSAARTSNESGKPRKSNAFHFLWWRDSPRENIVMKNEENLIEAKIVDDTSKKTSFDFFRSIKKRIPIKKLTRKSKQRTKESETCSFQNDTNCDTLALRRTRSVVSIENNVCNSKQDDTAKSTDALSTNNTATEASKSVAENSREIAENFSYSENKLEIVNAQVIDNRLETDDENVSNVSRSNCNSTIELGAAAENNVAECRVENVEENSEANTSNDNKVKASLAEELLKLSNYGWYWGPISLDEADAKLISEPDGAFLVRDSSDDRYVLTLSFKSSGKLLHARMEHSGGLFSLCNQSESEGFSSVADLIDYSMNFSQSQVFCYSRPKYPGHPSFPVRLTKPVSRFTQVRSLQYLCRFVIRQNTRLDNIHKLPLPKTIKGYIEEAHY